MTTRARVCLLLLITLSGSCAVATQAFGEADLPAKATMQPGFFVVRYSHLARDVLQRWDHGQRRQVSGDQRREGHTMGGFKLVIDRFEGSFAVVEYDGETFDMPRSLLPVAAKEGDTLTLILRVDSADTAERRKRIEDLMDDLFL